ncbi:hypothetical protein HUF18_17995 [Thalassolituus sp. ST750PaO-4]|uniref:hypothetical protein n=1 Tax=Thalassolituus sp. ST750PaO-4 TaxID=2742965 RepID=UPI001CE27C78|nr:hypothetical protein [Thalassolituus sp. ST750PaO-4]MCA6061678.1 hypothetical protein [Thalassolituus sp. ST750PaO-4]
MVSIHRHYACCVLYFISITTFAEVVSFPNTNTIPTTDGNTARLAGVTSISSSNKTANVVIDARDRFGNPIRVFKTANFNPGKLRTYVTTCVKNPVSCAASAALTSALIYYGYTLTSDGRIVLPGSSGSYQECLEKPVEDVNGGVSTALGPIPCASGPNWAGKYVLYTFQPQPQYPGLPWNEDLPNGVVRLYGMVYSDSLAELKTYYQNWYDTQPEQEAQEQPVSDEDVAAAALANPSHLQISPGVYGDVFDPISITETASDTDFGNEPQDPDPEPTEPMIGMDYVEEKTVDLSEYFDFGVGWLPKTCPADKDLLTIGDKTFTFEYGTLCSLLTDYASPFIRFGAVLSFIAIIFGGIRNE